MRILRTTAMALALCSAAAVFPLSPTCALFGQETTAALQGTVKDATGAVVSHATVKVTAPSLPGGKTTETDGKGYYHFANLPADAYVITVSAPGFSELKQEGLSLEVGHSPTIDLALKAGGATDVVEVSAESPQIDVTSVTTQTDITAQQLANVPRGISFQSVIQFAPAARNEPLMGGTNNGGNGSCSPGSCNSGNSVGYSIAGASDSENSYLVEGQETADVIGGYSHTNVPFEFIDEVQVTTSGVEAQYGGALGGVVNVIMQKGTSRYHGGLFIDYQADPLNAGPNASLGYNPVLTPTTTAWGTIDTPSYYYRYKKAHYSNVFPGVTLGGPLLGWASHGPFHLSPKWDDRLFFFLGFKPQLQRDEVRLDYTSQGLGVLPFSQNTNTYYGTARIDAKISERIRVFGSYLNEYQRQNGENLPGADSVTGQFNGYTSSSPSSYSHTLGYAAPNTTLNTGADITLTKTLVSTTRFGYFFENYHDFGYPTGGTVAVIENNGVGLTDTNGNPLPANLAVPAGTLYTNGVLGGALNAAGVTQRNASKSIHLDQDIAWYKTTPFGTHNFRFGYQLNRNSNNILQAYNEPYVQLFVGSHESYAYGGPTGAANCAAVEAADKIASGNCEGTLGYVILMDYGTGGKAISFDHSIYGQDSWTVGRGLTFDFGVRLEKEYVPGEGLTGAGIPQKPINFGWGDKIAPRIGVAYDVLRNGKIKLFGSYGQFVDQMKLNVAISSFGGQYWQNCAYALDTSNLASIKVAPDANGRYCVGNSSSAQANFAGGTTPAGLTFLEDLNNRAFPTSCSTCSVAQEGVAPGLKPYRQHQSVFGADYQVSPTIALSARYDRRRLDTVIEDSAIYNPLVGETFVIVNPGQGANATFSGFCAFLYGTATGCSSTSGIAPPDQTIPAARSYDGVEVRVNKALSHNWFGLLSYTYSTLRGNYTGLTTSDQSDGIGRNAPNNSRAFDEPYFSWDSEGRSSSGFLPTDRPHAIKADAYYTFNYLKRLRTDVGIFQTAYSGTPKTAYADIGDSFGGAFAVQLYDRGVWANVNQDPDSGLITIGNPHYERTPWYIQSDLNVNQGVKLTEGTNLTFSATFTNVFNQHSVTDVYEQIDSSEFAQYGSPGGNSLGGNGTAANPGGPNFYAAAEHPYDVATVLNTQTNVTNSVGATAPITVNSQYGKPQLWQAPRTIRLQVRYTF